MSKIRALELACSSCPGLSADAILAAAAKFAAFLGEETQVIGGVTGKPRNVKAKADAAPTAPIADPEGQAVHDAAQAALNAEHAEAKAAADAAVVKAKAETAARVAAEKATAAAALAGTSGVTAEVVKAAVGKLATNAAAGGAPRAREILMSCGGATNLSTLKPEFYKKALADITAALEAADVAA